MTVRKYKYFVKQQAKGCIKFVNSSLINTFNEKLRPKSLLSAESFVFLHH